MRPKRTGIDERNDTCSEFDPDSRNPRSGVGRREAVISGHTAGAVAVTVTSGLGSRPSHRTSILTIDTEKYLYDVVTVER